MLHILDGWLDNALDQLRLATAEPLTWLVGVTAVGWAVWRVRRETTWTLSSAIGYVGLVGWLVATLAITIYPATVSFDPPPWEVFDVQSVLPLSGTIESLGHARDRTMTIEEWVEQTAKLAEDLDIPLADVNLDRHVHGTDLSVILRDPVGNLLLFVPLGMLAPLVWRRLTWRRVALAAAAISLSIELSQLVFGFGSLASIDDVIFNTLGAISGFALFEFVSRGTGAVRERLMSEPTDVSTDVRGTAAV